MIFFFEMDYNIHQKLNDYFRSLSSCVHKKEGHNAEYSNFIHVYVFVNSGLKRAQAVLNAQNRWNIMKKYADHNSVKMQMEVIYNSGYEKMQKQIKKQACRVYKKQTKLTAFMKKVSTH